MCGMNSSIIYIYVRSVKDKNRFGETALQGNFVLVLLLYIFYLNKSDTNSYCIAFGFFVSRGHWYCEMVFMQS